MPKVVSEGEKRVALNCLVTPATRAAILATTEETKESQGEVVDRAVALLVYGEEVKRPVKLVAGRSAGTEELIEKGVISPEFAPTGQKPVKGTITVKKERDGVSATVNVMPTRPVQAWKRGPRPKGDKER